MAKKAETAAVVEKPLSQSQQDKLNDFAEMIQGGQTGFVKNLLTMCKGIKLAHDLFAGAGRDGQFRPWIEEHGRMGHTKAYECIAIYERWAKHEKWVNWFDDGAVRLLGKETTPDAAFDQAIEMAKEKQFVTRDTAKKLADRAEERDDERTGGSVRETDTSRRAEPQPDGQWSSDEAMMADGAQWSDSLPGEETAVELPEIPDALADAFEALRKELILHRFKRYADVTLKAFLAHHESIRLLAVSPLPRGAEASA